MNVSYSFTTTEFPAYIVHTSVTAGVIPTIKTDIWEKNSRAWQDFDPDLSTIPIPMRVGRFHGMTFYTDRSRDLGPFDLSIKKREVHHAQFINQPPRSARKGQK
jgi:hypothetical protein